MKITTVLFLILLSCLSVAAPPLTLECQSALETLFQTDVKPQKASEFLQLQGEITLHRLAWSYLRNQEHDPDQKVVSLERSITELLNQKYTNSDPEFIRARKAFEAQPLSRTTLAEIAPYLKEALAGSYEPRDENFKLNQSDLKLLSALAKFEKKSAHNGKFDHRMLERRSPQGILNFTKLINSSYKLDKTQSEKDLNIEVKLKGLENVMFEMQKKVSAFLNTLEIPESCVTENVCTPETLMGAFFVANEDVQNIFWQSLSESLLSDDILLEKLNYGDIWLKVKDAEVERIKAKAKSVPHKPDPDKISLPKPIKSKTFKPVTPSVAATAGLIIEDPDGIILKDRPGRTRSAWKKFDKKFKMAMAEAISLDEKVFIYQGKLFDRKTGKEISPANALNVLPPKKQSDSRITLSLTRDELKASLAKAIVNGDQSFIQGNTLFDLKGKKLSPALVIADIMSKKTGVKVLPARYKSMNETYLNARANALKNNLPYFRVGNKTMDALTGRDLSSPFRDIASVDSKIEKSKRKLYENLSDAELVINFNRDRPNPNCGYYGVLNKKSANLRIMKNDGSEVYHSEVLIGAENSDQRTRWTEYSSTNRVASNSTGAGIFTVRPQNKSDSFNIKHFQNNILSFKDEHNKNTVFALHQVPVGLGNRYTRFGTQNPEDRRISGGCANLKLADFKAITKWLGPSCQVFVLPEESNNKFTVRDNKLLLVSTKSVPANKTNLYNYSSVDNKPRAIDIKITNANGNTPAAREFVLALEKEKNKLMKMYRLSNDEYNDLAMLAYGILGNESEFGKSKKLKVKENAQFAVITARLFKSWDMDVAKNTSRGLTQIKFLPQGVFTKNYPEVKKENLMNPRNSAVATVAYLAEAAKQMRSIALKNKSDPAKLRITRENMLDYMGYLYQGRRSSLSSSNPKDQATPEFNGYYRSLQLHMSYIEISQRIE